MPQSRAEQHRDWLARLSAAVALRLRRLWSERVDPGDVVGSWAAVVPGAVLLTRTAIGLAASAAEPYVAGAVTDAGRRSAPQARLRVEAFTPAAAPRLLLMAPAVRTLRRISDGQPVADAMTAGQWLAGAVAQDVTVDAGRDAVTAAMAAEPSVTGYLRVPSLPCCGRCAVLAGRVYKVDGFARHPRCDCGMRPVVAGEHPRVTDVADYFRSLSAPEQNRLFGAGVADRIRDGDGTPQAIGRAVNANRQMWRHRNRPTPTTLADAATSRRSLFAALTEHGFLAA